MRALIVNADDYAFSSEITAGICEAHVNGIVTDASALVRSPYFLDGVARAADAGLLLGVHLDMVTPFVAERSECFGPEGKFRRELLAREFGGAQGPGLCCNDLMQMRDEMRRQIEAFAAAAGRLPSHLDYHYGWHYMPEMMALYLTVAEQYGIPVRWGKRYAGQNPYGLAPHLMRDDFTSRPDASVASFVALIDRPWEGVLEVVCHPGHTTPGGLPDPYNGDRERELLALTDLALRTALDQRGITLVNYDWLRERAPVRK